MSDHPVVHVEKFHAAFGHPILPKPTVPPADRRLLRVRLVMEEAAEFCKASGFPVIVLHVPGDGRPAQDLFLKATVEEDQPALVDLIEVADGLGDLNVVVNGSALEWGIPIRKVDEEISRSNLSKLGPGGTPLRDGFGKTLKGPNYSPPDIQKVLVDDGWEPERR